MNLKNWTFQAAKHTVDSLQIGNQSEVVKLMTQDEQHQQ